VKAALGMMGLIAEDYRLPLCAMAAKHREALANTLRDLDFIA
jgi:dihydrodipicolinate synthase/N-acetylneuraminate lyase